MADRKISDLTALTTPASGDFLPIVDISEAAAASKNKRITIEELMRGMPDGTAAAPGIAFETDPNTGIFSPGADQLAVATNGTQRLFVDHVGNVGINSGAPTYKLQVVAQAGAQNIFLAGQAGLSNGYQIDSTGSAITHIWSTAGGEKVRLTDAGNVGIGTSAPRGDVSIGHPFSTAYDASLHLGYAAIDYYGFRLVNTNTASSTAAGLLKFQRGNLSGWVDSVVIDNSGNVGIGTTSPGSILTLNDPGTGLSFVNAASGNYNIGLLGGTGSADAYVFNRANSPLILGTNNAERARIDSSGRLLVGTSSASGGYLNNNSLVHVQAEGAIAGITIHRPTSFSALAAPYLVFSRSRGTPAVIVNSGDNLGSIEWGGADGTDVESTAALIRAEVDGTPGANDMPGRLVFSVTADGAASPTERMRITSAGVIQVADAGHITVGTTTGTKIGTATTQKIGFFDKTPVVQPTAVADATDAPSVITQLNALLTRMRNLGLIAT